MVHTQRHVCLFAAETNQGYDGRMERQESRAAAVELLESVSSLLKDPRLGFEFASRGVNTSLALLAVEGTIAYLEGNKRRAAEDLSTVADEIRARIER